jgi:hypothetical protein
MVVFLKTSVYYKFSNVNHVFPLMSVLKVVTHSCGKLFGSPLSWHIFSLKNIRYTQKYFKSFNNWKVWNDHCYSSRSANSNQCMLLHHWSMYLHSWTNTPFLKQKFQFADFVVFYFNQYHILFKYLYKKKWTLVNTMNFVTFYKGNFLQFRSAL